MNAVKSDLIKVLDELPAEKLRALLYFAEWLSETDIISYDELLALKAGKEQFKKGECVFFEDIRR